MAKEVVEILLPMGLATVPFARAVVTNSSTASVDSALALVILSSTLLVASFRPLPVGYVLLALGGAVIVAVSHRPNLFSFALVALMVFLLHETDVKKITQRFAITSLSLFVAFLAMYFILGFNASHDIYAWRTYNSTFVYRASLGFTHPNRAMMEWLTVVLSFLVLLTPASGSRKVAALSAGTIPVYLLTDSRTSTILSFIALSLYMILRQRWSDPVSTTVRDLLRASPVLFALGSFALPLLQSNEQVNSLLTGRPVVYSGLLEKYAAFSPFGDIRVEDEIVDNGFIHLLLSKGIIFLILYVCIFIHILVRPSQVSPRTIVVVLIFFSLALAETSLLEFSFLFIVLSTIEMDLRTFGNKSSGCSVLGTT